MRSDSEPQNPSESQGSFWWAKSESKRYWDVIDPLPGFLSTPRLLHFHTFSSRGSLKTFTCLPLLGGGGHPCICKNLYIAKLYAELRGSDTC